MVELEKLGLVETNGKDGKHRIWNLTPAGQKALADGNELPPRPKAGTGAKAVRAGLGPHGLAVTDTILAYTDTVLRGRREFLTDWQVKVNHAVKETGLSFNTDAVLAVPTKTSEVRLFELDNGSMSQASLAKEVWDYEHYAGHRVWEGARGTIGGRIRPRPRRRSSPHTPPRGFYLGPHILLPQLDGVLVAFECSAGGCLPGPAVPFQQPPYRRHRQAHPQMAPDHRLDPGQGPPLILEAVR